MLFSSYPEMATEMTKHCTGAGDRTGPRCSLCRVERMVGSRGWHQISHGLRLDIAATPYGALGAFAAARLAPLPICRDAETTAPDHFSRLHDCLGRIRAAHASPRVLDLEEATWPLFIPFATSGTSQQGPVLASPGQSSAVPSQTVISSQPLY